jgi:uncharacterized protein YhhL (DUF1145 family)
VKEILRSRIFTGVSTIVLWGVALLVLVPPIPSDISQTYSYIPRGLIAAVSLLFSRILSFRREKHFALTLIEVVIFFVFGLIIFQRAQIR